MKRNILTLLIALTILSPFSVVAQASAPCPPFSAVPHVYCPLEPIGNFILPQVKITPDGLRGYLNTIVKIMISLAGALAVLYIIYGGIQYTLTESVFGKDDGKKTIWGAIEGLLLALSSYLILYTLNPDLLSGRILSDADYGSLGIPAVNGGGSYASSIVPVVGGNPAANTAAASQAAYDRIYNQWSDADQAALAGGSTAAANKWAGLQTQLDTLNNANGIPPATTGHVNANGLSKWGDPSASSMTGQTISGRQTYFAPNERVSDSGTNSGLGAFGALVEGGPGVVGSAASVYYPPGTLIRSNGILYVIDDNNISNKTHLPVNDVLTNNYTVDIFTRDVRKANSVTTHNNIEVLYVPPTKQGASGVSTIRNNPNNYIGSNSSQKTTDNSTKTYDTVESTPLPIK